MASDSLIDILTDLAGLGCNFGADVLGYRAAWMKLHPVGGFIGLGISPCRMIFSPRWCGSGIGTADNNALV